MKVSEIDDELLSECSHVVIYSASEDGKPFFMDNDNLDESYEYNHLGWTLHCDWMSTENKNNEDDIWKSWQHGWGRQARIVFNDIKDLLPKPYRFIVIQPFDVDDIDDDINLKDMIMGWISDENSESSESNESNEKNKKTKLEKMLRIFNQCLDDFSSESHLVADELKNMPAIVRNDYLFVKWS